MARKQMRIPGTERRDIPPAVDDAGQDFLERRRTARAAREKLHEQEIAVLTLMQAHKIGKYVAKDPDTGEEYEFELDLDPRLVVKRKHEADDIEVGEGVPLPKHNGKDDGVHPGLLAQAEADMAGNGVSVTSDGDVVVPDKAAPKKPGKGKAKKRSKPS